jgi:hypothetical protein
MSATLHGGCEGLGFKYNSIFKNMENLFKPEPANSLGLITNYRCTFRCRHCLYCSSPDIKEEIDSALLETLIDQIDRLLGRILLHIGGGEPLIHFELITSLVSYLRHKRILLEYVETNGSSLLKETITKLKTLHGAGLDRLLLSISPFHNEFISVQQVKRLFRDILSLFGSGGIFPWHPGYLPFLERVSSQRGVPLERYFDEFTPDEVKEQLTSIMYIHPGGRGAYLLARYLPCHPAEAVLEKNCQENLGSPVHAHLDYKGNYLTGFCSGLRLGKRSGLDLHNLYSRGVRLGPYPLLDILVNRGIRGLYEHALQRGYIPSEKGYVSPCHLCLDIRLFFYATDPSYEELYPSFFYDELISSQKPGA